MITDREANCKQFTDVVDPIDTTHIQIAPIAESQSPRQYESNVRFNSIKRRKLEFCFS